MGSAVDRTGMLRTEGRPPIVRALTGIVFAGEK